ncbi:MAG: DUF177 domain-containing protein [Syntrophorhabdaceae bacterium]|nr:DUF177 domain-containing protein [Syntrophorhabdaceae bacterium]MDD4196520.1 DUF177 domain-containing protein [Syntrophorhabdaceae bacterium]HOC45425.1 DUF177 domain-containing protein [Syntrophorhabdaceae bacterium]
MIRLSEIEDTQVLKGEMDTVRFQQMGDTDLKLLKPVTYELTVAKFDDTVAIDGPVNVAARLECGRCLEEFDIELALTLSIKLVPGTELTQSPEKELHGEDLDVYYYEGDEIDIDPFVYEEVMLNIPVRPLCSEACKGICPQCGKNRNTEKCDCPEAPSSLLGEKLKSFLN